MPRKATLSRASNRAKLRQEPGYRAENVAGLPDKG